MSQPSANTDSVPAVVKAQLKALPSGDPITVHFNPTSLVYTVENTSPQQGGDPKRRQHVAQFTAKLTMDLQFDSTDTGVDVRQVTGLVAKFMEASADSSSKAKANGANPPAPPVLSFDWGAYHFQGIMESFKETIDFFSAEGVPLRALVSIGLARQDEVFDTGAANTPPDTGSLVPSPESGSVQDAATNGGDPNAARALASANGIENLRFSAGADLQVGAGIQLNAAVGFVASASVSAGISVSGGVGISAGAGIGISAGASAGFSAGASAGFSAGAGFGASAGFSAGASAGFGASASAGFGASASTGFGAAAGFSAGASAGVSAGSSAGFSAGASAGSVSGASAGFSASASRAGVVAASASVSTGAGAQITLAAGGGALFGSRASARIPASAGAFAGLEFGRATVSTTLQLDPLRMLPATSGADVAVDEDATFALGGIAMASPGFTAGVGVNTSLSDRVIFDED